MDTLQKRLQTELEKFKAVQKDLQKCISVRQQLDAQLSENKLVKEELELMDTDSNVYKMMGPVLVKQDLVEAKANVQKRVDYISGEIKRQDGAIKDLESKQESHRETMASIQQQYQQAQAKATVKA